MPQQIKPTGREIFFPASDLIVSKTDVSAQIRNYLGEARQNLVRKAVGLVPRHSRI